MQAIAIRLKNQALREEIRSVLGTIKQQSGVLSKAWAEAFSQHGPAKWDSYARMNRDLPSCSAEDLTNHPLPEGSALVSACASNIAGRARPSDGTTSSAFKLTNTLGHYPASSPLRLFTPVVGPRPQLRQRSAGPVARGTGVASAVASRGRRDFAGRAAAAAAFAAAVVPRAEDAASPGGGGRRRHRGGARIQVWAVGAAFVDDTVASQELRGSAQSQ